MSEKRKRWRCPKPKAGELRLTFNKLPEDAVPDVIYLWGEGCHKADSRLLHHVFAGKQMRLVWGDEKEKNYGQPYAFGPSFLDELKERGYDISTIEFRIRKLPTKEVESSKNMVGKG